MFYKHRLSVLIVLDSFIVLTAIFASSFLVNASLNVFTYPVIISSVTLLLSHHIFAFVYHLYRKAWKYAGVEESLLIAKVVSFSMLAAATVQFVFSFDVQYRLLLVTWLLHMMLIGGSRFCWRVLRTAHAKQETSSATDGAKRTLIIGAGSAGTMVARQLLSGSDKELKPVAFVDDHLSKLGLDIMGIPVAGRIKDIEYLAGRYKVDHIVIAIPSLPKDRLKAICEECAKTSAKTQTIPMLEDIASGKVAVSQFRDVQVEDLLGREPVRLDLDSISGYVTGKVVLVTGAGGSIGSEVCRQISRFRPKKLVLLGHGENSIYTIEIELKAMFRDSGIQFYTEIADLQDESKIISLMKFHHPDVVYHAAAHKHVPLMQRNPEEAVKNNIIGTMNVAQAASLSGVGTFVMISTDKAVNPTSVMGSTKRIAEMIIQHMDRFSATQFVAVRFGNVLGSRGSVIPLFRNQIEQGGPVTVTHPDMVRYFMTIPEASRLVIQAGALARGGEIFVLDMGDPVKIVDLAKNLIRMSGYSIEEIGIEFTGMRPGEKLYEELLRDTEVHDGQVYPKIYVGKSYEVNFESINHLLKVYDSLSIEELRSLLLDIANNRIEKVPLMKATVV
ncbi:nucleoside-diphosphate sugar epimerase/dehydratase [Paenibacillus rhizophilus]|uniref:Polysaccharide biosynthesis protein n=1 Tax=Paenibacillus rhizophilus TaxID=1850366 RepID=A0A3N9P5D5_9BACL|nr:nucleoside-diphosphate sugar epimerase/dehydratase [Paenibacillus rhizophilus]RQW10630.1 polysaccharide biosynthesis protein [Paenibacillus rhizophilus]